jgi:two-component system nitrate/nitrite response regulator NarL
MPIRVIVFDDNRARQEALRVLIDKTGDMICAGTFDNCRHVLHDVKATSPDVVLMDIDMPVVDGIEGLKLIREHAPQVLILMQTVFDDDDKIFDAIHSGANGYFLKRTPPQRLIEGIRDVLDGGAPMTASVAKRVIDFFLHQSSAKKTSRFNLTEREHEVLSLLVKGMSYKMIADATGTSFHTINSHCRNIYAKLHVHSATEAVARALKERIV